jgi:hypothetical protein
MVIIDGYQTWRFMLVGDFPAYLSAAHGLLDGTNPYTPAIPPPNPFIYPLFIAWLWIPFALIPPIVAAFIWFLLSVAILLKVLQLLTRLLKLEDERQKLLFSGALLVLFVSIIQFDVMYGQINLFVLLLLLLGVERLEKSPLQSGLSFGMAMSAKLMPFIMLPVIAMRRPRIALVVIVSVFLLTCGVPYLIAGPKIIGYYQFWFNNILASEHGEPMYLSFDFAGVLAQLAGMAHPTIAMRLVCGLLLLSFPIILLKRGNMLAAFFLAFMLLPLTATYSEPHHLIVLMPAMGLLLATMLKRGAKWTKWCGVLAIQLSILWGYKKAIPFDTAGMLVLFGIVFSIGLRSRVPLLMEPANEPNQNR